MLTTTQELKTYADYAALEEGAPYQLIDGELVMSPALTPRHQDLLWELGTALRTYVRERDLGKVWGSPIDVYFSDTETYQPDLVYIAKNRLHIVDDQKINGAPDLVVEVLSPSTGYYDLTKKKRVYAATGVKEYWIVDPLEKTVDVLVNRSGEYETVSRAHREGIAASHLLDGFTVDVANLFEL